jgi:hypothetical protein
VQEQRRERALAQRMLAARKQNQAANKVLKEHQDAQPMFPWQQSDAPPPAFPVPGALPTPAAPARPAGAPGHRPTIWERMRDANKRAEEEQRKMMEEWQRKQFEAQRRQQGLA